MSRGYKTDCPECGGNNLYVTPDNGVEYCFNCGYRKGRQLSDGYTVHLSRPDPTEIRQFYTRLSYRYHSSIPAHARRYLNDRGVSDEVITNLRIGYCPDSPHDDYTLPVSYKAGITVAGSKSILRGRIVFPYFNPLSGEVVDLRGRLLDVEEDENNPKYRGPYNAASQRGADEWPYNAEALRSDVVVITEGELKAIASTVAGIPAVGIPGISSFKWRLRLSLNPTQKRVVVFDSEAKPHVQESVNQSIDKLARLLPELHVATLPLAGRSKVDLDSFILTSGPAEFKLIVDKSLPYETWAKLQRRGTYVSR